MDILREQFNILSGEVALHQSVLKRLSEEAGKNAMNEQIEVIFLLSTGVLYDILL